MTKKSFYSEMDEHCRFKYNLLENVHLSLKPPTSNGNSFLVRGDYTYFHYECDESKDSGWGCGYRTLQSICSWIKNEKNNNNLAHVPSLHQIQEILVNIGDKPAKFIDSRDWIGALEVFYVIDTLYDVSCRIQHIAKCEDVKKYSSLLRKHFEEMGSLIMMGGDVDASSKGIAGIHIANNDAYLLIVDPHYVGEPNSSQELIDRGYVKWQNTQDFSDSSFYNLCIPQL